MRPSGKLLFRFRNGKGRGRFAFASLALAVLLLAIQAYRATNYIDPDGPYFAGNFAAETTKSADAITIVSYNIWFGENIDGALSEIEEIDMQHEVDIILLLEMDETGTEQMARKLKMNYIYFPAAIEPTYDKNFGNAILSRWPMVDPQKLILPHKSLSNRMSRIATRATIKIPGADILVYSLHTESIFSLPQYRREQYQAVLEDVDPEIQLVIVGGDFNSFTRAAVAELEEDYKQAGFVRGTKDSGSTAVKYGIELSTDHIFAKGFALKEAGNLAGATASDHLPIWVTLIPE